MNSDLASLPPRINVVCSGDPMEAGLAQGSGLAEMITTAHRRLKELEVLRLQRPWWLPLGAFLRLAERKAQRFLATALEDDTSGWQGRLDGIARGAGLRQGAVCLMNALEPALSDVRGITEVPPLGACAAIVVRGRCSATGEPILARNFDYLRMVRPFFVIRDERPADGLRSLVFSTAPLAGAVDGINERGLCVTYNYAYSRESPAPASSVSLRIAEVLARCGTVAEATSYLQSQPRWGSAMLMLADAEGDIAALELSHRCAELRRPAAGEDMLVHTNAYCTRPMCGVQIDDEAEFTRRAPAALRGIKVLRPSRVRDARFAELLARHDKLGTAELTSILSDHGPDGRPSDETICRHSEYWNTTACLQFYPRSRRMRVSYTPACQAQFVDFQL